MSSSEAPLSGVALMRAMKEMRALESSPPEGIVVHFSEEQPSQLMFDITGPVDTPFEGGVFRVRLQLGADYPNVAPKGWFLTKIFHPNMNGKTGEICVSTLKKDWQAKLGLRHVCVSIRCLLIEPNPESALNEDAAKLLLDNYADYAARAKIMTKIHAKPAQAAAATAVASEGDASPAAAAGESSDAAAASSSSAAAPSEQENRGGAAAIPASGAAKTPLTLSAGASINPAVAGATPAASAAAKPAAAAAPSVSSSAAAAAAAAEKAKALKKKASKRL
jgi:ubiquitin-conjugating enzyme E2 S